MSAYPRTAPRRPLDPTPELHEPSEAERLRAVPESRPTARRPVREASRHIPRFFVVPSAADEAKVTSATGAHRFPSSPTPVLGASIGLLGYDSVTSACRPWQRGQSTYRFARVKADDPSSREVRALSSARFPKV